MTGIATARAHRHVAHRVGGEARCCISVAIAALCARNGDVRGRGHSPRVATVMACRAIRIAGLMSINTASPAREVCRSTCMAGGAIAPAGCNVIRIRCRTLGTFAALVCIGTIVAGVAAARRDRRMVHRITRKACCCFGMTIAALDAGDRNMRRRSVTGRGRAVMTV